MRLFATCYFRDVAKIAKFVEIKTMQKIQVLL